MLGAVRVTVFSPDDLALLKGGPALRRTYLDQVLVSLDVRNDAVSCEYDRALRQRNALLKQTRGRLDEAAALTLEVWDTKLVAAGEQLADRRARLVDRAGPAGGRVVRGCRWCRRAGAAPVPGAVAHPGPGRRARPGCVTTSCDVGSPWWAPP